MMPIVWIQHRRDRERVAHVRDAAQLLAERGRGPGRRVEAIGGVELVEQRPGSGIIVVATSPYYTLPNRWRET